MRKKTGKIKGWENALAQLEIGASFKIPHSDKRSLVTTVSRIHASNNYEKRWTVRFVDDKHYKCERVW